MDVRSLYTLRRAGGRGLTGVWGGLRGRAELVPEEVVRCVNAQERHEGLGSSVWDGPQYFTPRWRSMGHSAA
eukprot:1063329-Pyramimonas_sp.AAC.1